MLFVQSMNLNVPERHLPTNLMQEGATIRVVDFHSEVEYTKPPDYLQVEELRGRQKFSSARHID